MHKILSLVLLGALVSFSVFAKDGISLTLSAEGENRYGGKIQINVGQVQPSEIDEIFQDFTDEDGRSLLADSEKPFRLILVVPKGVPEEEIKEFTRVATEPFYRRYPKLSLVVEHSFVDLDADDRALDEAERHLNELKGKGIRSAQADSLEAIIEESIRRGREDNRNLRTSWMKKLNATHPYNTLIVANAVALTKFAAGGMVMISKYGLNVSSALISFASGSVSAFFGYNAIDWSNLCTGHQIPFWNARSLSEHHEQIRSERGMGAAEDFARRFHLGFVRIFEKPIQLYNRTGWFKSATVNTLRSVGLAYIFRLLAFQTGQTIKGVPVESPNSLMFFGLAIGLALPEVIWDGFMDDGARGAQLKKRINHQSRSYMQWGIGIVDTFMHGLFRTGLPLQAYIAMAVSVGSKVVLWRYGKTTAPEVTEALGVHELVRRDRESPVRTFIPDIKIPNFRRLSWTLRQVVNLALYAPSRITLLIKAALERATGKFALSDFELVHRQHSTDEAWNLNLTEEDLHRLRTDTELKLEEFEKMLNLKDGHQEMRQVMWNYRQKSVASGVEMAGPQFARKICAAGLRALRPAAFKWNTETYPLGGG